MHQNAIPHLDELRGLFLAVVPEAVVDPEAQQLQRRLGAEEVMGRHVEVVHEPQQAFPTCRHKHAFGSLLEAALHDGLDVVGGGLDSDGERQRYGKDDIYVMECGIVRQTLFRE